MDAISVVGTPKIKLGPPPTNSPPLDASRGDSFLPATTRPDRETTRFSFSPHAGPVGDILI